MPLSRRQLLKALGVSFCGGMLPLNSYARTENNLPIPPLLESSRGQPLFLSLQRCHWDFYSGQRLAVWGFNGQYLGPTIRINRGDYTKLICSNQLDQPVSLTFSGLQLPASIIGNVHRIMKPQSDWSPVLPIRQLPATCWYHASTPGLMGRQVYNGLAGMCIVIDKSATQASLPGRYGIDDIPIIIQDKRFTFSGELIYNPEDDGFIGDTLLTNGVPHPHLSVPSAWIRLRLLNASNARRYIIKRDDDEPLMIIASDLGLLEKPLIVKQLSLAPGERREILIDMTAKTQVTLSTDNPVVFAGRLGSLFDSSNKLISNQIVTLNAANDGTALVAQPPEHFYNTLAIPQLTNTQPRLIKLNYPAAINGQVWNNKRIDVQVKIGSVERWIIEAERPQSFYIQGVSFLINSRNGQLPTADDSGWKDTVWVDGTVELLVHFNQISSAQYPFLFGSQTLEYADQGAIGQLVISGS